MHRTVALRALAAFLALLVVLLSPIPALAQSGETIRGRVVNGTPGGGPVAGLQVVLHQDKVGQQNDLETTTDDQGNFRFEGITLQSDVLYGVSVAYQGAVYGQDLPQGKETEPVQLSVYEPTDDPSMLTATAVSVLMTGVDPASQTIRGLELVAITNTGDRSFVPGQDPMKLLRFSLPEGARDLQVEADLLGADVVQVDRGFALTGAVPPGDHQFMFGYIFPYSGSEVTFTKSLPFGAQRLRVLFPEGDIRLSSERLGAPQVVTVGDAQYQLLTASDLPRGAQVPVRVSGLPGESALDKVGGRVGGVPVWYAAPAGTGLLAVALVVFALLRRRRRSQPRVAPVAVAPGRPDRQGLLHELAQLEQEWEDGLVADAEYERRREELTQAIRGLSGRQQPRRRTQGEKKPQPDTKDDEEAPQP